MAEGFDDGSEGSSRADDVVNDDNSIPFLHVVQVQVCPGIPSDLADRDLTRQTVCLLAKEHVRLTGPKAEEGCQGEAHSLRRNDLVAVEVPDLEEGVQHLLHHGRVRRRDAIRDRVEEVLILPEPHHWARPQAFPQPIEQSHLSSRFRARACASSRISASPSTRLCCMRILPSQITVSTTDPFAA